MIRRDGTVGIVFEYIMIRGLFYIFKLVTMGKLSGKKVAILTENGFEEIELTSPMKALKEAGANVQIVSPQKRKVKAWNHDHWSIELTGGCSTWMRLMWIILMHW